MILLLQLGVELNDNAVVLLLEQMPSERSHLKLSVTKRLVRGHSHLIG